MAVPDGAVGGADGDGVADATTSGTLPSSSATSAFSGRPWVRITTLSTPVTCSMAWERTSTRVTSWSPMAPRTVLGRQAMPARTARGSAACWVSGSRERGADSAVTTVTSTS